MKTILAPVDLSPISDRVVSTAADLAHAVRGRLVLVHVISLPATTADYAPVLEPFVGTIKTAAQLADVAFARWEALLQARSIPTEHVRMTGLPHVLIPELAKKLRADFVVMGSHGHTAFYDLVVGTTTRDVIAKARCPVVVVPSRTASKSIAGQADLATAGGRHKSP